ncbi:hypothetical protein [Streptomyces lunaelactis]|uniref:hypothetical protein n=1 Tax=Streptomyces lunaelactis TaxID=1535768 RepID=UPI001584E04D|nr:hypothetical protein [Streptomyces lunaelactis]NUK23694.1 hypothetical protein [Streptomyces lunaelactis]
MAEELTPVFHLPDRAAYEVSTQGGTVRLTTSFGVLEGDAAAFAALARAANRAARHGTGELPSRPLYIPQDIKEAAEKKARHEQRTLADVMRAGIAHYVAGGIEPLKPARSPRPAPGGKPAKSMPSTSLRAGHNEWTRVEARCAQDTERLGFHVNPSRVITQYLRDTYLADGTDGE